MDSDSEDDNNVNRELQRQAAQRRHTQQKYEDIHAAALAEDASVFDYDGVYDQMKASKTDHVKKDKIERKSKYIGALLQKAQEREKEDGIRFERRLRKEQEKEKEEFGDKEKFITSAYRRKLEEDNKWLAVRAPLVAPTAALCRCPHAPAPDPPRAPSAPVPQEQKRKEEEDERNDVTKKGEGGMMGFYANLNRNIAFGGDGAPAAAEPGPTPSQGEAREPSPAPREPTPEHREPTPERRADSPAAGPGPGGEPAVKEGAEGSGEGAGTGSKRSLAEALGRRNDENAVMSAKERYLARKRARAGAHEAGR